MSTELVPLPSLANPPGALTPLGPADLVAAFLAGRNPRTLRAYAADLACYLGRVAIDGTGPARCTWLDGAVRVA